MCNTCIRARREAGVGGGPKKVAPPSPVSKITGALSPLNED